MKKPMKRAIIFGNYLGKIRTKRDYSLRQLAKICNLNYSFISQLENHRRGVPKISTMNKLAKGLKISPVRMYQIAGIKSEDINKDNIFRKNLRRIRNQRGFSLRQLSYLSHVTSSAISKMETGKRGLPRIDTLVKLAKALHVTTDDLLPHTSLLLSTVTAPNKTIIDLEQLINQNPQKLSWGSHPLDSNDLMAISLWFKTKILSEHQDVLGLYKLGISFDEACRKYHVSRLELRNWLMNRPNYPRIKKWHLDGKAKIYYRRRLFPKCLDLLLNHHQEYITMVNQFKQGFTVKVITRNSNFSKFDLSYLLKNRNDYPELLKIHKKGYTHWYDTVKRNRGMN